MSLNITGILIECVDCGAFVTLRNRALTLLLGDRLAGRPDRCPACRRILTNP